MKDKILDVVEILLYVTTGFIFSHIIFHMFLTTL